MPHKLKIDPMRSFKDWKVTETFQNKATIEGLSIFLNGISASHETFGELVGAAGSLAEQPSNAAWYELIERITIVKAVNANVDRFTLRDPVSGRATGFLPHDVVFPKTPEDQKHLFQFSKSNGVALDSDWEKATIKAACELIERHLILKTWLGDAKPEILNVPASHNLAPLQSIYEVMWVSFGSQATDFFPHPIHSCGVFLLPRQPHYPLAFGFGADATQEKALAKAERETVQRLGFIWGEEIPQEPPSMTPSPFYHQEYFLCPSSQNLVREWLMGRFLNSAALPEKPLQIKFIDLSCPDIPDFQVARAYSPDAIPLVFGHWPGPGFRRLDEKRRIHPIA